MFVCVNKHCISFVFLKMKSDQTTEDFTPGDVVFAKMKGYPFWPARVSFCSVALRYMTYSSVYSHLLYVISIIFHLPYTHEVKSNNFC